MDFNKLSKAQQKELEATLQRKQIRDFLGLYNRLSHRCFTGCCNSFTERKLTAEQKTCVENCMGKFFAASARIGMRFSESQQLSAESGAGGP